LSFAIVEKSLVKDVVDTEGTLAEVELGLGLGAAPVDPELEPPHAASPDDIKAAPATKLATLIDFFIRHLPWVAGNGGAGRPLNGG
jgi:hypothetical protein